MARHRCQDQLDFNDTRINCRNSPSSCRRSDWISSTSVSVKRSGDALDNKVANEAYVLEDDGEIEMRKLPRSVLDWFSSEFNDDYKDKDANGRRSSEFRKGMDK